MEITKEKLVQYAKHPRKLVVWFGRRGWLPFISDKAYIKLQFKETFGYPLDLEHPRTFSEKLQWLKLYDRKPEYTTMVDKYAAKQWVAERIGEQYIIPTLGVWDHFDDIDFDALPDQFVLKCTHDSGSVVIVSDKAQMDKAAAKKKLESGLARNWFNYAREWAYKDVPPRIIAEEYIGDASGREPKDYKIFNFDGEPKIIQVDYERFSNRMSNLFSADWKFLDVFNADHPHNPAIEHRPEELDEMLRIAGILSKDLPHVRTDFYDIDGRIYFGELTLYHGAGLDGFKPESFDEEMGEWLKLPRGGGYLLHRGNSYLLVREDPEERASAGGLTEYKLFCFNGEPRVVLVGQGEAHSTSRTCDYFDINFERLPFALSNPRSNLPMEKPAQFEEMLEIARKLSAGRTFLRVDTYIANGQVYIGELTFYHGAGLERFDPAEWNLKLGEYIKLPMEKENS